MKRKWKRKVLRKRGSRNFTDYELEDWMAGCGEVAGKK